MVNSVSSMISVNPKTSKMEQSQPASRQTDRQTRPLDSKSKIALALLGLATIGAATVGTAMAVKKGNAKKLLHQTEIKEEALQRLADSQKAQEFAEKAQRQYFEAANSVSGKSAKESAEAMEKAFQQQIEEEAAQRLVDSTKAHEFAEKAQRQYFEAANSVSGKSAKESAEAMEKAFQQQIEEEAAQRLVDSTKAHEFAEKAQRQYFEAANSVSGKSAKESAEIFEQKAVVGEEIKDGIKTIRYKDGSYKKYAQDGTLIEDAEKTYNGFKTVTKTKDGTMHSIERSDIKFTMPASYTKTGEWSNLPSNTRIEFKTPVKYTNYITYPEHTTSHSINEKGECILETVIGNHKYKRNTSTGVQRLYEKGENGQFVEIARLSEDGKKLVEHMKDGTTRVMDENVNKYTIYDKTGKKLSQGCIYDEYSYPDTIAICEDGSSEIIPGYVSFIQNIDNNTKSLIDKYGYIAHRDAGKMCVERYSLESTWDF